jgi:uncharacterized protein YcbK (DUF882 family)
MRTSTLKAGLGIRAATLLLIAASPLNAGDYPSKRVATRFPAGDGKIAIYSYHLDETLVTTYRKSDVYDEVSLQRIDRIFRSRSDHKRHHVNLLLIELLDHLQDYFEADCIELISGYRSPTFNETLAKGSRDVAFESMHVRGRAADIHIDEVTEETLAEYVRSLEVGGVGYYPAHDFVHIDIGKVRNWNLPDKPGRPLMAMRKGAVWEVITDQDIYLPGESIGFAVTNTTEIRQTLRNAPILQIFRRGLWRSKGSLPTPRERTVGPEETWRGRWRPSAHDPYGKYRIVITETECLSHLDARSNEFYRKRR